MGPYRGAVQGPVLATGAHPFPAFWEQSDGVKACPHLVWEHVLVTTHTGAGNEVCIRCRICRAPRCGHSDDPDPCMLVRHHRPIVAHQPWSHTILRVPDLNDRSAVEAWLDE